MMVWSLRPRRGGVVLSEVCPACFGIIIYDASIPR